MSTTIGYSTLQVIPSTKGFGAALSRDINPQMGAAGKSSGHSFGKFLGAAAVGGFIATGISKIIHTGVSETLDASGGVAQLAAGIKSTGNAANVSVKGMTNLAASIQGFSGQTDDSIVAAEQLLLTFTNIKNNGPDKIFDLATLAAANMAAKMGGDASSNAILLGKALNNPIQGISALTRVGVAFTDGQKETIKAMQASGNIMGAQKIILKELETEFGGAAKAAGDSLPGGLKKSQRAFEDAAQSMAEKFIPIVLPAVTSLANFVSSKLIPTVADFVDGFIKGTNTAGKLKDRIIAVYNDAFKPFVDFLINNKDKVGTFIATVGGGILVFKGITAAVKGTTAVAALYRGVMTSLMLANGGVAASSGLVVGGLTAIRTAIFSIPIVGWIAAAVTGLALLYIKFEGVRNVVAIIANEIIRWFQGIANVGIGMVNVLIKAWNFIPWHKDIKLLANVELPHLATAAENAAKRIAAASYAHPTRGPIKGSGTPGITGGGGTVAIGGAGDSSKFLDAIGLKIAIEDQKKNLRDFSNYLGSEFISSIKDSGTKASDVIGKLVGGVSTLAKGFSATITDAVKQATFNLASTKIVNALETKLLGFQKAFDSINTARLALKVQIDDATAALNEAIKLKISYADGLSSGLKSASLSLSEFLDTEGKAASPENIIAGFTKRLATIKGFSSNLKSLAASGLNKNILDEIIGMGALDGGALAASLAGAGQDQINLLNQTGTEIGSIADEIGKSLSEKFYGQGEASALALLNGFKSQDSALLAQANAIGTRMAQAIADSLSALRVSSGGADFDIAAAKAATAKIADDKAKADAAAKALADKAAADKATVDKKAAADAKAAADKAATSADIAALAKRFENALSGQAKTLQRMDRQGGV